MWAMGASADAGDTFEAAAVVPTGGGPVDPGWSRVFDVRPLGPGLLLTPRRPGIMFNNQHPEVRRMVEALRRAGTVYFRVAWYDSPVFRRLGTLGAVLQKPRDMVEAESAWPPIGIHRVGLATGPHRVMFDHRAGGTILTHNIKHTDETPTWVCAALFPHGMPVRLQPTTCIKHVPIARM